MDPMDINLLLQWRAIERFASVVIGALAIYLGYKLFMNLPEKREAPDGEMKLMLPGDISVYASRVAPGVFFALFGTAMVFMSFVSPLKLDGGPPAVSPPSERTDGQKTGQKPARSEALSQAFIPSVSYVTGTVDADRISTDRAAVLRDLAALRELEAALNASLSSGGPPDIEAQNAATLLNTLQRVKLTLMLTVWDTEWGDAGTFAEWARQGALLPPPEELERAAELFLVPLKEESP